MASLAFDLLVLSGALAVDAGAGYPPGLYQRIGHPVTWMGAAIDALDRRFNREDATDAVRRVAGIVALAALLGGAIAAGWLIEWAVFAILPQDVALAILAVLASSLLAQRSLDEHIRAVADALQRDGIDAGRKAVAMVVGRDTAALDEAGICRAAIESLAESASDGVTAPAFWIAFGGLPGGLIYKAVNTADSMIGHRTPRHEAFGWAAARLDDIVNLPASRLCALLIVIAAAVVPGASARQAWRVAWRDAGKHKSPNAGWPEAAMAGALGLKLAGPRRYDGELVDSIFIGEGRYEATLADLRAALRLARIAAALQFMMVIVSTLALAR